MLGAGFFFRVFLFNKKNKVEKTVKERVKTNENIW